MKLVEELANHKGVVPDHPDFCLYEDTDLEALETFFERTQGPLSTQFHVDDAVVNVEKTVEGEITVAVDSVATSPHTSD